MKNAILAALAIIALTSAGMYTEPAEACGGYKWRCKTDKQ